MGAHPAVAGRAGRWVASVARHLRPGIDPDKVGVTLVAVTFGFGAPRTTAVLAVLGYRIINYWLPLIPGAIAYLRLRLRRAANGTTKPATAQSGALK